MIVSAMTALFLITSKKVRKILVIFFLLVHLTGNTELGQLFKLPKLVSHFFQHHRQDSSISFIDFMIMHYSGDDGTPDDDDMDKQLPCHNANHNTLTIVYSPMVKDILPPGSLYSPGMEYNGRLCQAIPSKHVLLIFQPPKSA